MAKILLVEDNELNRDMLSRRLARRGYEVVLASHGGEGVVLAQSEGPDLILMDMGLPVLDGWEATRRLKADPRTAWIPVVALTGHALDGAAESAAAAGCDAFVVKPCTPDDLVAKMWEVLQLSRAD